MLSITGIAALFLVLFLAPLFIVQRLRARRERKRLDDLEDRLDAIWRRSSARRPLDFLSRPGRRSRASARHRRRRLHRMLEPLEREAGRAPIAFGKVSLRIDDLESRLERLEEGDGRRGWTGPRGPYAARGAHRKGTPVRPRPDAHRSPRPPVLGALLLGGRSHRLGADKARLSIGEVELGLLQARRLEAALGEVVLVARSAGHYTDYGFPVWGDTRPGQGPVAAIERALEGAGDRSVLFLGCDLPFVRVSLLRGLAEWRGESDGRVPRTPEGALPLCGVLHPSVLPRVRAFLDGGGRRYRELIGSLDVEYLEGEELSSYGDPARLFFNVNTMDAYREAVRRVGGGSREGSPGIDRGSANRARSNEHER